MHRPALDKPARPRRPRLAGAAAAGVVLALLLGWTGSVAAQTQPAADDSRVAPEGPYRSRMRIVEPGASPPAGDQAPPASPYASALGKRAAGYAAAARGEDQAAVEQLQGALDANGLAPLAERQIRTDLVRLWLRLQDDDALLAAYRRWSADGHTLDAEVTIAVAHAAARNEEFALARGAIDSALADESTPPDAWLELQIYVLARDGAPRAAARIKSTLMDLANASRADWLQLSELYRQAGAGAEALAAFELGYRTGRLNRPGDVLALASAYRREGLPRDAADLLQANLDSAVLADEPSNWQRLADAHLAAREDRAALAPLARAATLSGNAALRYALGQLQHRLGQDEDAIETLRLALRGDLGADTGRAWLLLGEVLLAGDRRREARRALREAAELGGSYREALALLAVLDGDGDGDENDSNHAARVPGDSADAMLVARDGPTPTADAPRPTDVELPTKTVPLQRFYYTAREVSSTSLPAEVGDMIRRLRSAVRRERLTAAGPLHIVATSLPRPGQDTELQVGIPIRTRTAPRGAFENRDLKPLTCAWREYRGPVSGLAAAWQSLMADLARSGYRPDGETRTVVRDFAGGLDDTLFELQVGVLPTGGGDGGS